MKKNNLSKLLNDRGVTAIVVALLLTMFLGIAALAVDIGYDAMAKNQLQNAADAAALAGARKLGDLYKTGAELPQGDLTTTGIGSVGDNCTGGTGVKGVAYSTACANKAAGENIQITNDDIKLGTWDFSATPGNRLNVTTNKVRAVQVLAHRDATNASGPISTFFARIFGRNTMDVSAVATALLTPVLTGTPQLPFVMSNAWFNAGCPTTTLRWNSSDQSSCAAWWGKNKNDVTANHINCAYNNTCLSYSVGQNPGDITNGKVANLFDPFYALWQSKKDSDSDNNTNTWTTVAAVVNIDCNKSGHSDAEIVGFATVAIGFPHNDSSVVSISTSCNVAKDVRGGGTLNGSDLATIPSLVQ